MAEKYVYFFGAGTADGNAGMKAILGGKGANLAEMTAIGLPGDPFAGQLANVQFAEVDLNPADRSSTWIEGGEEICIRNYGFDETITGI